MNKLGWVIVPALLLTASCKKQEQTPQKTLHEVMKDEVDKRGDYLWELTNPHIGEDAGLDVSTMTDADWTKLASAAVDLQQAALNLASLKDPIVVAKPGVKIADEGVPGGDSAASVQANVDKDPQGLRDYANSLAQDMADLVKAANKHDAAAAGPIINQLDGVCESCHLEFWYPSQKKLVDQIRAKGGDAPLK
jgi:cytochrome c556